MRASTTVAPRTCPIWARQRGESLSNITSLTKRLIVHLACLRADLTSVDASPVTARSAGEVPFEYAPMPLRDGLAREWEMAPSAREGLFFARVQPA
jgi:hypothetical protein